MDCLLASCFDQKQVQHISQSFHLKFLLLECMELILFLLADTSGYGMATWAQEKWISGDYVRRNQI